MQPCGFVFLPIPQAVAQTMKPGRNIFNYSGKEDDGCKYEYVSIVARTALPYVRAIEIIRINSIFGSNKQSVIANPLGFPLVADTSSPHL
jgi:hypothetical protein